METLTSVLTDLGIQVLSEQPFVVRVRPDFQSKQAILHSRRERLNNIYDVREYVNEDGVKFLDIKSH